MLVGDEKFPMDMYFKQTSRDKPDGRECPGLQGGSEDCAEEERLVSLLLGPCVERL